MANLGAEAASIADAFVNGYHAGYDGRLGLYFAKLMQATIPTASAAAIRLRSLPVR